MLKRAKEKTTGRGKTSWGFKSLTRWGKQEKGIGKNRISEIKRNLNEVISRYRWREPIEVEKRRRDKIEIVSRRRYC